MTLSCVRFVLTLGCALALTPGFVWAQRHVHGPASGIAHGIPQFCGQPDHDLGGERRLVESGDLVRRQGAGRGRCRPDCRRNDGHV